MSKYLETENLDLRSLGRGWYRVVITRCGVSLTPTMPITKTEAVKVMRWLESLTDWSRPLDELKSDPEVMRAVQERMRKIHLADARKRGDLGMVKLLESQP